MNDPARLVTGLFSPALPIFALLLLLGGCATRPINPPITQADPEHGLPLRDAPGRGQGQGQPGHPGLLGRRHACGRVLLRRLEFLRRTEVVGPKGNKVRLLDQVNVITGVSGGSFTALAYGLYGDKLFDDYEQRFLKRDVQGELVARALSPRTGATCRRRAGAVPSWRRSSTTKSCSTAPPSATSIAATAR